MLSDTAHSTGSGMCCEVQSTIMMACRCVWQEESLEAKCIEGVTRALGGQSMGLWSPAAARELTSKSRTTSRQPLLSQHQSCQG